MSNQRCSCGLPLTPFALRGQDYATHGIEYWGAVTLHFVTAQFKDVQRVMDGDTPEHDVINAAGKRYFGDHGVPDPPPLSRAQRAIDSQIVRIGWTAYQLRRWLLKVYGVGTIRDLSDDQAERAVVVLGAYPTANPDWEQIAP